MKLNIFNDQNTLTNTLAKDIISIANQCIKYSDRFNFVLTGGNSPKALYAALSTTYKAEIDWSKVFFFFGDERTVLPFEKDYNGLMAKESFFDNLTLRPDQVFYVDTNLEPEEAAADYESRILKHFSNSPISFDLVLLGMGDDAHTASIFPHTTLVNDHCVGVKAVWVEKLNTNRVSLTYTLINQAKNVIFITFGENKAKALNLVMSDVKDFNSCPSQLINPVNGALQWYIDEAAASLLNK